jgi:hypothetical protein
VTITSATANYGLSALSTPTGTSIANDVRIGVPPGSIAFADADIVYSFKVVAAAAGNVATLTLSSGAVAQTTGTPTITDGDGKDWEGVTLPTMVTGYAILMQRTDLTHEVIVASSDNVNPSLRLNDGNKLMPALSHLLMSGTIA